MNPWKLLGLPQSLDLAEETLSAAFRDAGKLAHPDAGGDEATFNALQQAREILASPSKRLRAWMELHGSTLDPRGTVSPELLDLFASIGAATQSAETAIRKRDATHSALARALIEPDVQLARETIESLQTHLATRITSACTAFPALASHPDPDLAATLARDLAFLEKWRTSLRALYSRLV